MREAACELGQEAHVAQRLRNTLVALLLAHFRMDVHQTFGNNVIHLRTLVERCHRILENHLNLLGNLMIQLLLNLAADALALKADLAPRSRIDADDRAANGGLARAGLAHEAERFALVNIKAYALDRHERVAV